MDHTHVGLRAALRALSDVVAPAVDPDASQAREQLRLSIDYLEFVIERLDLLHDRALFELRHHLAMARGVHALVREHAPAESGTLGAAIDDARILLDASGARSPAVKACTAALAAAISAVVREAPRFAEPLRSEVERCVLQHSAQRIRFERSWYLPLGLDPDIADVRPLAQSMAEFARHPAPEDSRHG